jgi:aspartyl-tRNA(Asn)/glutamyl-tRNA(Gln) amidotransferase subunit A
MSVAELLDGSMVDAATAVRRKDVSSVELTEAAVRRAEALEPKINAFISLEPERALAQARAADRALATGSDDCGPLHGVPLAHKDLYYRQGVVTTCGALIRKDFVPDITATVLDRLATAGALNLGGLNMAEFALGPTGHNVHFGDCRNPWDTSRVTGGSSSGSGAATAAGSVFAALGSDTGGSIRLPAAYCGLVGLKPTNGRVSRAGVMPLSQTLDCVGPLTRTVRDAARIMGVIAGADPADTTCSQRPVPDYEAALERPLAGRRVGLLTDGALFRHVEGRARQAYDHATTLWEDAGIEVVEIVSPDFDAITAAAGVVMRAETAAFHRPWLTERPGDYSAEVRLRLESGLAVPAVAYLEAMAICGRMLERFCEEVFSRCDALIAPVANAPPPHIEATRASTEADLRERIMPISNATRPINYLGLPSLALPTRPVDGLPYSFQLIGRPFAESLLLALGHVYETVAGLRERPLPRP